MNSFYKSCTRPVLGQPHGAPRAVHQQGAPPRAEGHGRQDGGGGRVHHVRALPQAHEQVSVV